MASRKFWSEEEKAVIRKLHPRYMKGEIDIEDIHDVLPGRTESSIRNMMDDLGLSIRRTGQINLDALKKLTKVSKGV